MGAESPDGTSRIVETTTVHPDEFYLNLCRNEQGFFTLEKLAALLESQVLIGLDKKQKRQVSHKVRALVRDLEGLHARGIAPDQSSSHLRINQELLNILRRRNVGTLEEVATMIDQKPGRLLPGIGPKGRAEIEGALRQIRPDLLSGPSEAPSQSSGSPDLIISN